METRVSAREIMSAGEIRRRSLRSVGGLHDLLVGLQNLIDDAPLDRGEHALKGVPGQWRIYGVTGA